MTSPLVLPAGLDAARIEAKCAESSSGSTARAIALDFGVCHESADKALRLLANAGRVFPTRGSKHGATRYFIARNVAQDYARTLRRPVPTPEQMKASRRKGPGHETTEPVITAQTKHTVYARPERTHDRIDKLAGTCPPDTPLPRVALRAGAFDFAGHPSRRGDRLVWRDGRVTDLQGRALETAA